MWDCWHTEKYAPEWDDNKGTTHLVAWTEKGKEILQKADLRMKEIGIEHIETSLTRESLANPNYDRTKFFSDVDSLSPLQFMNKYVPITGIIKLKTTIRLTMHTLHLHNAMRKTVHVLRKIKEGSYR